MNRDPALSRDEIERLIPHRPPFLWIDEIVEADAQRVHARKFLDPQLDVFSGHYPQFPVLPGVLLCEAAFQAGAVLIARFHSATDHEAAKANRVPVVTRVNNVKFRRMVRPGETLDIETRLTEQLAGAFFLTARISVEGRSVCSLEFACALAATGSNRESGSEQGIDEGRGPGA